MNKKTFPLSQAQLEEVIAKYPTPFHIYDEKAIRENLRRLFKAFSWAPSFREHFAVKATPNPALLRIMAEEGAGADCSSLAELELCAMSGIEGEKIMLTSNDTPADEFQRARELGAIINLDDISHIDYLEKHAGFPDCLSFRYSRNISFIVHLCHRRIAAGPCERIRIRSGIYPVPPWIFDPCTQNPFLSLRHIGSAPVFPL